MSIHFSCPHCQALLVLPDNCGGQTTRCPSCSDSFVIPGSGATGPPTPVCAVLAPVEGNATEADLERSREAFERLTAENVGMQVELARRQRNSQRLTRRAVWLRRFQTGRRTLDHSIGRIGGFFVTIVLAPAVALVLVSVLPLSAFGYFVAASLTMIAAGAAYLPFSFYPDDARLALLLPRTEEELAEATRYHDALAAEEAAHRARLTDAEQQYQRVKLALSSRMQWLRTCQWQQMSGRNFVNFLKQVFEEHGYTVEPTGKVGQAGIDLVVVRDGTRVAVQAKGLQAAPLDNQVIQQTDAGKARYRCHSSAVITNAQILPSARQLAQRLGCTTIDAAQIPDLIEGRIGV